ncbi:MAG: HAMP domain-containing histidine kinase, partial [Oscillospiraceae bacterium]|nr:HAMP domain-containing histidine kinase [Oscillospiraceae bacterium]
LALLCAVLMYMLVFSAGTFFVDRYYMSPDAVAERNAEIYTEFSRYVTLNEISGTDSAALAAFLQEHRDASIAVYTPEDLGMTEEELARVESGGLQSIVPPRRSGISGRLYPLRFADGLYFLSITDNSRIREDLLNRGISLILAVAVLVGILFLYTSRLTQRVILLSQETAEVGAGDLTAPITLRGEDELSTLAEDIDGMRSAIIERMGNEKRAWEANSELITAMSHDIRTPMTALIGYLELLKNYPDLPADDRRRYLTSAYGKALDLKDLTDQLFKYFLVFGRSELELSIELYDAHLLLMQLLGEAQFDLTDTGFSVQHFPFAGEASIRVDAAYLKRVVDNLVSNIKKYADRDSPVVMLEEWQDGMLNVTFSNTVSPSISQADSTKIGLRTCEKILTSMGGSFSVTRDGTHFSATFSLPAEEADTIL